MSFLENKAGIWKLQGGPCSFYSINTEKVALQTGIKANLKKLSIPKQEQTIMVLKCNRQIKYSLIYTATDQLNKHELRDIPYKFQVSKSRNEQYQKITIRIPQ